MADDDRKAFFTTLPGILSGVAALMVASTSLYFGLRDRAAKSEAAASAPAGSATGVTTSAASTAAVRTAQPTTPAVSLEARRQQAERLAGDWLAALGDHDVGRLVRLAETPYYFDQEIIVTREALADRYRALFAEKPNGLQGVQITKLRARTVAEMKEEGASLQRDRIFSSLSLGDDDWGIEVHLRMANRDGDEGMTMFARLVGDQLKIVGTWD
jgi:hypothetical protein